MEKSTNKLTQLVIYPMSKHQSLTIMLADRSKLSSERLHPAADSDRYRHSQSNSGWSLEILMEEQEEGLPDRRV